MTNILVLNLMEYEFFTRTTVPHSVSLQLIFEDLPRRFMIVCGKSAGDRKNIPLHNLKENTT